MTQDAGDRFQTSLRALAEALAKAGAPAMIIGGVATIARGVARLTNDIDAAIWGEGLDIDSLLDLLATHGIMPRIADAAAFATRHRVLLLRHAETDTPLDISLAALPFEKEALARAELLDLAGVPVRVATAEDLVVFKAVAWREQDRLDIERLLALHGAAIDLTRVRPLVAEFAELLDEAERINEFDEIIRRSRAGGA